MSNHPSHETRFSDASSFDEICVNCRATDRAGSKALSEPCPKGPVGEMPSAIDKND